MNTLKEFIPYALGGLLGAAFVGLIFLMMFRPSLFNTASHPPAVTEGDPHGR